MKLSNYREKGKKSPKQTTPYVTLSFSAGRRLCSCGAGSSSRHSLCWGLGLRGLGAAGAAGEAPREQPGGRAANASRTVPGDVLTQFLSVVTRHCEAFPAGKVTSCFVSGERHSAFEVGTAAARKCHSSVFGKEVSKREKTLKDCKNRLPDLKVVQEPKMCLWWHQGSAAESCSPGGLSKHLRVGAGTPSECPATLTVPGMWLVLSLPQAILPCGNTGPCSVLVGCADSRVDGAHWHSTAGTSQAAQPVLTHFPPRFQADIRSREYLRKQPCAPLEVLEALPAGPERWVCGQKGLCSWNELQ